MIAATRSILIVDDEADLCEILRFCFEDDGFQVETAGNGMEAASLVSSRSFDVVLTDIRMPGSDGIMLINHIRTLDGQSPVIFIMTGYGDIASAAAAALGVRQILQKPFSMHDVLSTVKRGLADHENP
jgi:DNA-binding NtrC family response regulator